MMKTVSLAAATERYLVPVEATGNRMIEWIITTGQRASQTGRAPLNLALVIDRSGSMHGDKLRYVKQAACHVLSLLGEQDRIAVVAFDDEVMLLASSQAVTPTSCREIQRQIDALQPGGSTNLADGWLWGCQEVANHQSLTGINRVLLFTDGQANRGITDVEELTTQARQLQRRGISTSTFGVGSDFNEHLLEPMADQGGGHYFYIDQPSKIAEVFRQELGELINVVAREAVLSIPIPAGVVLDVLGDVPHEHNPDRLRIYLHDLVAGEQRCAYTRVLTPRETIGSRLVLRAELGYADLDGHSQVVPAEIAFNYAPEVDVQRVAPDAQLLQRATEVQMAAATMAALKLEHAGQRDAAQAVIQQHLSMAAPHMPAPTAAAYQTLACRIGNGLSEADRKATHFDKYKMSRSRK